jgi:hypothetical protein
MDLYPKKPYESLSNELKEKIQIEAKKTQFPFDDSKINSDNYLKFIVEELKPYIDKKYSVFTTANHTAILESLLKNSLIWKRDLNHKRSFLLVITFF